jgi:hypothetical protein
MSVVPKSDIATRAEIASLDRIRRSPQRLRDANSNWTRFAQTLCSDGGGCLESDGERRISGKRRSNETAIPALPGMSKFFLAIIVVALGTLVGLFAFTALTL